MSHLELYHSVPPHFLQLCTLYSCRVAEFERTCLVRSGPKSPSATECSLEGLDSCSMFRCQYHEASLLRHSGQISQCSFTGKPIGHLCNLNVMLEPIQVVHPSIGPFPRTMDQAENPQHSKFTSFLSRYQFVKPFSFSLVVGKNECLFLASFFPGQSNICD